MPKSILVITYVNETNHCSLKKAHDIAAPLGAEVDVVRFVKAYGDVKPEKSTLASQATDLAESLDKIFADYEHRETIKSQVVVTTDIVKWVLDYCQGKDFDLIVKAGNRTESLFHTPCDWELIRSLEVPVLIASQQHWRSQSAVLAAVDAKVVVSERRELNDNILAWAKKWAQTFDCHVHLIYTFPVSNILKELDMVDVKNFALEHRTEGEAMLAEVLKDHDLPNVTLHVAAGAPDKAIPHCANEVKAELVIMGSLGHTGLKGMLMGNMAEKVMHNLRTNSLTIQVQR